MYTPEERDDHFTVVATSIYVDGEKSYGTGVDIDNGDIVDFILREQTAKFLAERVKDAQNSEEPVVLEVALWQERSRREAIRLS